MYLFTWSLKKELRWTIFELCNRCHILPELNKKKIQLSNKKIRLSNILAIRIISLYTVWLSRFLLIWFWAMFHWLYCFNKSWWWSSSSVTINHCSKQYRAWMTTFSTNPYFIIFQRFECSTTLSVKEVLYNKKTNFLFLFQNVL